jgi:hypothetical protein
MSTILGGYLFGARGVMLLVALVLGFFPVAMLSFMVARRLAPPSLVLSDDDNQ